MQRRSPGWMCSRLKASRARDGIAISILARWVSVVNPTKEQGYHFEGVDESGG